MEGADPCKQSVQDILKRILNGAGKTTEISCRLKLGEAALMRWEMALQRLK